MFPQQSDILCVVIFERLTKGDHFYVSSYRLIRSIFCVPEVFNRFDFDRLEDQEAICPKLLLILVLILNAEYTANLPVGMHFFF